MAEQYLFVRCWPGFTEKFPFDQFQMLPDDKIGPALDEFALEWERNHRAEIEEIRTAQLAERTNAIEKRQRQSLDRPSPPKPGSISYQLREQMGIPQPVNYSDYAAESRSKRWYHFALAPDGDREPGTAPAPEISRIGYFAGWVTEFDSRKYGASAVSPLTYIARVPDEDVAAAIAEQVALDLKKDYLIFQHLGPRFGWIPVSKFKRAEQLSIGRGIVKLERGEGSNHSQQMAYFLRQVTIKVEKEITDAMNRWSAPKANDGTSKTEQTETAEPSTGQKTDAWKRKLGPAAKKAFSQYQRAIELEPALAGGIDDKVYEYVEAELLDDGESMPTRDNWKRQVRKGREFHDCQKNKPRAGRVTGRSIIRQSDREPLEAD